MMSNFPNIFNNIAMVGLLVEAFIKNIYELKTNNI